MAHPGLNHHPGAPLRRRRPQKEDGTGGQAEQALGRSRGGFGTKIHGAVSGLGLPAKLILTPGQAADMSHAKALIEGLPIEVAHVNSNGIFNTGRTKVALSSATRCGSTGRDRTDASV
ncbi:hypothetical protein SAMN05444166_0091 [Singulisphaera sp. GP187]|nr:hypothetical protein SAMN05444166_0091 [Singulisphaera sp. GP187]